MPLRLKQLNLHGYKTFATKSEFVFGAGVSAIVGPNGSGKSNIVDSIRWVLGEQSFGLLRGKKTEDMIFAGSEQRPRAGMAEAALTFDNSDGWLPIDFSEVTIARRAYRDGENEYLLNGQRVRLRDVTELLARCGLAERTYTIIGQGLIDTALSLKAEERRALFEEAAGIGVYRNKREDALRKLETTQRNLERVLDILAEIKPRLRSLERQAQRARDFNQVKADLDAILKVWYGYHWHRAVEAVEQARLEAELTQGELAEVQSKQEGYDQEVAGLRAQSSNLRSQLNRWRQDSFQLNAERESLARELAVADERLRSLSAQRDALLAELTPLASQLEEQTHRAAAARAEVERLAAEAGEAQRQLESAQAALARRDAQRAELQQRETEARAALARLDAQLAELRAWRTQSTERRERLAATLAEQRAEFEKQLAAEEAARARAGQANAALNALQASRAEAEARMAAQTDAIRQAEAELANATERAAAARAEVERLKARQEVLDQARAELAGFASGAKTLLSKNFPTRGALAELLNVPAELETAISAALGAYLEALVVNDYGETDAAIAALGEANGRAALLPLQHLSAPEPLSAPDDPDVLGVAARLVTVDDSLRPAVNLLLGQTIVVRDRAAATRLLQSAIRNLQSAILVTLTGEVYHTSGPVIAGRDSAPTTLQQARERRDLSVEIENARARGDQLDAQREAAARAVTEAREKLVQLQATLKEAQAVERQATIARDSIGLEAERLSHNVQFHREQLAALEAEIAQLDADVNAAQEELARLSEERRAAEADVESARAAIGEFSAEEIAAQAAHWQTQAAVAARAAQDAGARADDAERARAAAEKLLNERRNRAEGLEAEAKSVAQAAADQRQKAAAIEEHIAALNEQVLPAEQQHAGLEAELTRVESGDTEARVALHAAERRNAEAQLEYTRKKEALEGLRRRVEEDFGLVEFDYGESVTGPTPLPLYPIVEKLERVDTLSEGLEEQLNRKRGQLRRMGLINPDAEKEYVEVRERHDFLTTQVADLQAAQTQLREVIAEMDVLMERDFRRTFDAVANEFRDTFARLFGGGTAKLVLTDPEHLSTTGVDIQCKLPGKRAQTLSMLSGGERSLTACALVFALLRVSPTPFVVLDEVDAMLDEANVGRYREMLLDLSSATQFIIVTHNRNTVQAADTVYGVTMGADSASQVIGLKLDGEKVGSIEGANGGG
jgi:chromosome segregation protein